MLYIYQFSNGAFLFDIGRDPPTYEVLMDRMLPADTASVRVRRYENFK